MNRCFFLILNRQCGFSTVCTACDLRKQPPFYPTKLSLRNDCRNSKLMTCLFSDLGVLLIGWFIPQMSFRGKTSSEGKTRLRLTQHQCTLYDLVFVFSIKEPSHDTKKLICSPVVQLPCAATGNKYLCTCRARSHLVLCYDSKALKLCLSTQCTYNFYFVCCCCCFFLTFPKWPVWRWEMKQTYHGHGHGSI